MKLRTSLLMLFVATVVCVTIMGCTYHEHYHGSETMVDEGVVVREHYVVE